MGAQTEGVVCAQDHWHPPPPQGGQKRLDLRIAQIKPHFDAAQKARGKVFEMFDTFCSTMKE